jgi:hypothetical protein
METCWKESTIKNKETRQIKNIFQNQWISGLFTPAGVLKTTKTTFRKLDLFPSSGERMEIPTLLGLLEKDNLNRFQ